MSHLPLYRTEDYSCGRFSAHLRLVGLVARCGRSGVTRPVGPSSTLTFCPPVSIARSPLPVRAGFVSREGHYVRFNQLQRAMAASCLAHFDRLRLTYARA